MGQHLFRQTDLSVDHVEYTARSSHNYLDPVAQDFHIVADQSSTDALIKQK